MSTNVEGKWPVCDISLLTHDKRKCYNTVKHCKPNTVNEKKSNQRKQNKLRGIKEDLQRLFGQVGRVYR